MKEAIWRFFAKFHCELNLKEFGLRQKFYFISVSVDLIRKYARKARDYEKAYRSGHKAGKAVETAVKLYKSHTRIFNEIIKF